MKTFAQFIIENYRLKLERDKKSNMDVLHVINIKTGGRTEIRGKSGYETDNYDSKDPLHKLIDKIGKSTNISNLMNGDDVSVNPEHPKGKLALRILQKIDGKKK